MVEYATFGANPKIYHLNNIILHLLNCLALYVVVGLFLRASQLQHHYRIIAAVISASLFAIHPQHVETVVWVADRKGLLCTFFLLLSFAAYLNFSCNTKSVVGSLWFKAAFVAYLLALLSKPSAVVWPCVLVFVDILWLNRLDFQQRFSVKIKMLFSLFIEKWAFILLAMAIAFVTLYTQDRLASLSAGSSQVDLVIRLFNAIYYLFFYLYSFLIPFNVSPFHFYPEFLAVKPAWTSLALILGFILTSLSCVSLFFKNRYWPLLIWLCIIIMLLPVSGIVKVGAAAGADRYTYLSLIPLYILTGVIVAYSFQSRSFIRKSLSAAFILYSFITFTFLSKSYVHIWRSDIPMWTHAINSGAKYSALPYLGIAAAYYDRSEFGKALEYFILADEHGGHDYYELYIKFAHCYRELGMDSFAQQVYQHMLDNVALLPEQMERINRELRSLNGRAP